MTIFTNRFDGYYPRTASCQASFLTEVAWRAKVKPKKCSAQREKYSDHTHNVARDHEPQEAAYFTLSMTGNLPAPFLSDWGRARIKGNRGFPQ